jgi:OmpA-OmpF porin, OOP family
MTKKWLVAMLGAAAMSVSAGAVAQGALSGGYVGLDVGQAEIGDEDDTGFKIFGGYQFHRNIAAEVGYGLLVDKGGVEVTALEVVAVGMFPLANQFSIFGKLGLANVEVEIRGRSDDKTELTYGIGAQYDFTRNLGARLQWQRYDTDQEIDLFTIGVIWKF